MAGEFDKNTVRVSLGKPGNLGKSQNVVLGWKQLRKKLGTPVRSNERHSVYRKAGVNEKNRLKGLGGWFLGAHVTDGRRKAQNVHDRDIITLDLDNLSVEEFEAITKHKSHWLNQFEFFLHTTRSHTPEEPRIRVVLLASHAIEVEAYEAVTRIMAWHVDDRMETVDPVSFRIAQMMYLPTCSTDQEYVKGWNPGRLVDPQEILNSWPHDWRNMAELPRAEREEQARERQMQAENPLEKRGIIGAFCRAYSIQDVIDEFLPDVYGDPDPNSTDLRYTYLGGHSQYGAVVYGDGGGQFMYSWHGTDPACEKLCNAWDLVRIHKFSKKDEKADDETDVNQLPSQKEMTSLAKANSKVNAELASEKIDLESMLEDLEEIGDDEIAVREEIEDPFEDEDDEETRELLGLEPKDTRKVGLPPYPGQRKVIKRDKNWSRKLEATLQGEIKPTVANLVKILTHDPRFRGLMALNAFTGEVVATRTFVCQMKEIPRVPLRDSVNGDLWSDFHDAAIKALLSSPNGRGNFGYGMSPSQQALSDAIRIAAGQFVFHPVIDHLVGLPEWDGVERLPTFWHDYMGTPNSAYYRETGILMFAGAIARLFSPGLAFDYVPILISKENRRKSTFVQHLGFGWWGGELTADFHNLQLAAEQMMGKWFLEMSEITNMKRADAQSQKSFISRTKDKIRLAYDRRAIEFRRQNLFIGTTNEYEFLRDDQNRRMWPIKLTVEFIDTDKFLAERDQIWAEALVRYKDMLAAKNGDPDRIHFYLSKRAAKEAKALQDSVRVESGDDSEKAAIEDYLDKVVPLSQVLNPDNRADDLPAEDEETMVRRTVVCVSQVADQALGEGLPENPNARASRSTVLGMRMSKIDGWVRYADYSARHGGGATMLKVPGYGRQRVYVRESASWEDIMRGYEIVSEPEVDDLMGDGKPTKKVKPTPGKFQHDLL